MKKLLLLLALTCGAGLAQLQVLTDTLTTPQGGTWGGTIVVTLNNPQNAGPLYYATTTLTGWSQTYTVSGGAVSISLYANSTITPTGTSYTARYTPTSGSAYSETWVVPVGATTIREVRSTTVPTPRVMFTPSQITQASAALGNVLRWNGSAWSPYAAILTDPMTTTGDTIYRTGGVPARLGVGSTGQVMTVAGGVPAWASGITGNVVGNVTGNVTGNLTGTASAATLAAAATALAANPSNCSSGLLPRGVDASGAGEGCAAVGLTSEVAGILPNSNTTAASANTASAIVARDSSGNFIAGNATLARVVLSGDTEPTAGYGFRGVLLLTQGGSGVSDSLRICIKAADGTYSWVPLF